MLPKQHRLIRDKDFQRVFKKGKSISNSENFLYVKFIENNLPVSRFGFVVSNKISNRASIRNRIKRILREAVKKKFLELKPGLDVVIIAQKGIEKKSFIDILSAVSLVFKKVK